MQFRFPKDFIWGAASSAYQIEDACFEDGKTATIYDYYSKVMPETFKNAGPEGSADFYHHYREDIRLMKEQGLKSFRFSICWARILSDVYSEPNPKGIAYYNGVIDCLIENGIIPFFDLYHCDMPMFVCEKGGPTNPEFVNWFVYYARICFEAFGDRVRYWSTVNEPSLNVYGAYARKCNGPFGESMADGLLASYHMMLAHYEVVRLYRRMGLPGKIGAVNHFVPTYGATDDPKDQAAADRYREFYAGWWMEPMLKGTYPASVLAYDEVASKMPAGFAETLREKFVPMDFAGINYYNPACIRYNPEGELEYERTLFDNLPRDDYGFQRYSVGMMDVLLHVKETYGDIPVFITENGIGTKPLGTLDEDLNDQYRIDYLRDHIRELNRCVRAGINLKGYFIWTFLDTYEGNSGAYLYRFGMVQVTPDKKRRPRKSYFYYRQIIAENEVH